MREIEVRKKNMFEIEKKILIMVPSPSNTKE